MILLRELAAWREHAPWPKDFQVEQDLLLTRAMAAIFSDDFLSGQVVMRGGTALHKIHLAPAARYSEDIDLVLVGDRPEAHVQKALRRVLEPVLGAPRSSLIEDVKLTVRNLVLPSRVLRQEYRYVPLAGPTEMKVKIEVNCNERRPFFDLVDLAYPLAQVVGYGRTVTIRSYDVDEMLGTKMRALLQRDQGRDLFDLWWALTPSRPQTVHHVTPRRIIDAFTDYLTREGTRVTFEVYDDELRRKTALRSFRGDVNGMLRAGLPPYDVDAAAEQVRGDLLSLLPATK
jgi:predicted nucleotidyltransferase component of viral defense system